MKSKKAYIRIIFAVLTIILLFPIPMHLKDGGTIEYRALLYKVSAVHSLASMEDMEKGKDYNEGIMIEFLGFEIYNSVNE